jgi:hypothetical protein
MTERTLAASPNLDGNHRQRSGTDHETSPNGTQVQKILPKYPHLFLSFSLHHQHPNMAVLFRVLIINQTMVFGHQHLNGFNHGKENYPYKQ